MELFLCLFLNYQECVNCLIKFHMIIKLYSTFLKIFVTYNLESVAILYSLPLSLYVNLFAFFEEID